jgi:plastocyanin
MNARKIALAAASTAFAAALVVAVPVIAGTGAAPPSKEPKAKVRVQDNFFDPRSVGVTQDGQVRFVWKGSNRHNVRFTKVPVGASRKGSRTKTHGSWTRSFSKPGLYRYVCTLFSGMRGTITVKPPTTGEG